VILQRRFGTFVPKWATFLYHGILYVPLSSVNRHVPGFQLGIAACRLPSGGWKVRARPFATPHEEIPSKMSKRAQVEKGSDLYCSRIGGADVPPIVLPWLSHLKQVCVFSASGMGKKRETKSKSKGIDSGIAGELRLILLHNGPDGNLLSLVAETARPPHLCLFAASPSSLRLRSATLHRRLSLSS
jgi:hypothetical protein